MPAAEPRAQSTSGSGRGAPELGDSCLRAKDVKQSFRVGKTRLEVLGGVTLEVPEGERLFLCGASGAGKTTLLYTLAGLERPVSGSVSVGGVSIYNSKPAVQSYLRNEIMGYVFQHYNLLPELTALENAALPARIAGNAGEDRAVALLERVGLGGRLRHLPSELSGGEQQRVAIARALVNSPRILFADEPTGNLDSKTGNEVMDLLLEVASEGAKTLIVVTHDTQLAERGDRQLTIHDGKITSDR
jgi:predicted ABC-type transport system involved in lysophospholipase L1 biosynthesis ATPase subunit